MPGEFTTWNKSFFDYLIRADIGPALKTHYDHRLEGQHDHRLEGQPSARRLTDFLNKIDELEDRKRAPRNE
jgi:hypothetical protein